MKTIKFLIIFTFPLIIFSQDTASLNERYKKMQSRKIAFICDKIELSPNQSESFWPIYNMYSSELRLIMRNKKKIQRDYMLNKLSMDDIELGSIIDSLFNLDQEYLNLKIKYVTKFAEIISNKQMFELYEAEEGFKKELLRRIKKGDRKSSDPTSPTPPKKIQKYKL